VKLDEDMLYVDEEEDYNLVDLLKAGQTLNLLYVAVTRAKYSVKLPQLVQEVISSASYLRAEW
jgi:ATP-dependent exoDNAse (exonuclease V) beta subunit